LYPWGNASPDGSRANFASADTAPVGSYPNGASMYGAMDMAGNVWEWVADWYGDSYYSASTGSSDPTGPGSGSQGIVRGGSWYTDVKYIRAAERDSDNLGYKDYNVGFRCAQSAAGQ
jgi:serine/threonine-protein kinase